MEVEIRNYGSIRVAEIDCEGCSGEGNLNSPDCRQCVFESLGDEKAVEWTILKRSFRRVYTSPDLSKLAKTLAVLEPMVKDRAHYSSGEETKKCKKCVDRRMEKLTGVWPELVRNPHELSPLDDIVDDEKDRGGEECSECSDENFLSLVQKIKSSLKNVPSYSELSDDNYDEVFEVRVMPFFVESVWSPPEHETSLLDSYDLPDGRGQVKIYEQEDRPIPFYELELPELNLPPEQVQLLYEAYNLEFTTAPGHARFARPSRLLSFSEDWYNTLLHMVRDREDVRIPAEKLRKLATWMANWLTYRALEPLSQDEHITDIYITAPPERKPITITHERWGTCETGINMITPSLTGLGEVLASRQDRSFDQTNPQLDAEIPELGLRLFMSRDPAIWESSVMAAIRKRRRRPWTQPLFLEKGSLTPLASAVLGNFIRLGASAFVIGDIGTAKTSTIETLVPEIGSDQRIICYQDTEELHLDDFVDQGYTTENVRVRDPEDLRKQVNAFLRGGSANWLITEVRSMEAVKAALGAAARRGSQPVVSSFHVQTKREMYDLVCNLMDLPEAAYKYIDLIASTAKFDTPEGVIRRVTGISEVLKDWEGEPEYTELFTDNREEDRLEVANIFKGPKKWVNRLNSFDLSDVDMMKAAKKIGFRSPKAGGSAYIPRTCEQLAIDEDEFLKGILAEARMKSDLLQLAREKEDRSYLELPFVSKAYDYYFASAKKNAPDYEKQLEEWEEWLEAQT